MLRIATSPNRRGKFPGLAPLPGGADAQRLRGFSNKTKNTAAFIPIARTNAAVSVVPPKLPTHGRQSLLCALPVESTAAITSGARLPLLHAQSGFRGKLTGVRSGPALCAACTCPRSLGEGRVDLTFPGQRFFLAGLYHGFSAVSTQQSHFLCVSAPESDCSAWWAQARHSPYRTLPSHCRAKPCSAIRWARTSSIKRQSRW